MKPVNETAFEGAGLSVPQVIEREAEPHVAIAWSGPMADMPMHAPAMFPVLHGWMASKGLKGRAGFFRYRGVGDDGNVRMEVGTTVNSTAEGEANVLADTVPAGRYAHAVYTGPYDRLYDAMCMLSGWVKGRNLRAEESVDATGRFPAVQIEVYRVSPADTPEPAAWKTDLLVKLAT